jgi:hypothetical protein
MAAEMFQTGGGHGVTVLSRGGSPEGAWGSLLPICRAAKEFVTELWLWIWRRGAVALLSRPNRTERG